MPLPFMCLILIARNVRDDAPLIVAANRDEFHDRPTAPAVFWRDPRGMLAGRDERAGGTWLGVTRSGRLAAVTNIREPGRNGRDLRSRGHLTTGYLAGSSDPWNYVEGVLSDGDRYGGFNLVVGDIHAMWYGSNRTAGEPIELQDGITGIGNGVLKNPWTKIERAVEAFRRVLDRPEWSEGSLFDILASEDRLSDADLPDTGVGSEMERALSARFIRLPGYGTRSSTLVTFASDGHITFVERTWSTNGGLSETRRYRFRFGTTD